MVSPRAVLLVSVLVAVLGAALRLHRHLVLRVPKVGFILHAVLGGSIPGYISKEAFERGDEWIRPGDVFVTIGAKSGTTWMLQTVQQIRTRGKITNYSDILLEVPWAEFVQYPGQSFQDRVDFFNSSQKKYAFRAFKSHYGPPLVKFRKDVKYIVGYRNPVDSAASLQPFLRQHTAEFVRLWGGFPDRSMGSEQFQHAFLVDMGDGATRLADLLVLDHMVGWWKYRNEPNVLIVHYNDRMKDRAADVDRLAAFLGVELTPQERRDVLENTSFKWMKENSSKFSVCGTFDYLRREKGVETGVGCLLEEEAMVAKGAARDGENELPPRFKEALEAYYIKRLGEPVYAWMKTGGIDKMPNVEIPGA